MESALVYEPMFAVGIRRYMVLDIGGVHHRVKIPFRYNRVMCEVHGDKTVQELVKGDTVQVVREFKGVWVVKSVYHI